MGVLVPVTRISNHTEDVMVLITLNVFGHVEGKKVIAAGRHVDFSYRKGVDRTGADVTFLVRPETRSDVVGKQIFPIQVFDFANIDVVYKSVHGSVVREYEGGAFVDFDFYKDTLFRRIGLVRWFHGVVAAFGNCYYADPDVAQVIAPSPYHYCDMESVINGSAQVATPAADMDVPATATAAQVSASTILSHEIQVAANCELVQRNQT